jgi:amidase
MARSVRDCALFLDAMAGFQPSIPTSYPPSVASFQDVVKRAGGKVRIAFSPDLNGFAPVEPVIMAKMQEALSLVEKNGGVVEAVAPDLVNLEKTYHTLRGLLWVAGFRHTPDAVTRHFKKTLVDNWSFGKRLTIDDVADANLDRTTLFNTMLDVFSSHDVLACATVGNMPHSVEEEWVREVNGQKMDGYMDWLRFAFLATTTGLPAISVPVGLADEGVPIGIQLIGPPRGEAILLAAAKAVEMAVGGPLKPIDPVVRQ